MGPSYFEQLFHRCLNKTASPQDRDELLKLLPEHERQFKELVGTVFYKLDATENINNDTAKVLLNRIFAETSAVLDEQATSNVSPATRTAFLRKWQWWAAAAILFIVATTIFLVVSSDQTTKNTPDSLVEETEISPGKAGAILTLADGSKVSLDTFKNATVALQGGVTVKAVNGVLVYEGKADVAAYNTITTPKGRQFKMTLPDGTQVWLNAGSSIRYPTTFAENQRLVDITGEAYFEVVKNSAQPFSVNINGKAEVEVLGTHFNVNAYENEKNIKATLLEGSVRVSHGDLNARLKPGQQAQVPVNQVDQKAGLGIEIINNADIEKVMAWKDGVFHFSGLAFDEITRQLERWYDIQVVFEGGIPNVELIGELSKDVPLSGVLRYFGDIGIHYRQEGRKLIITTYK